MSAPWISRVSSCHPTQWNNYARRTPDLGSGPGGKGGRTSGHDRIGWGGPLPSRERNPTMLISNSNNSNLVVSIVSPLPPAPGQPTTAPPAGGQQYTNEVVAPAHGSTPDPAGGPAPLFACSTTAAPLTKKTLMINYSLEE